MDGGDTFLEREEKGETKTNCDNNVMGACNFSDSFFSNLFSV